MSEQKVLVLRGTVFVPDPAAIAAQRLINIKAPGHGARMSSHLQKYTVGQKINLPKGEAARLARLGIVEIIGEAP